MSALADALPLHAPPPAPSPLLAGVAFSRESGNLLNAPSFKYSALAQKSVVVTAKDTKKALKAAVRPDLVKAALVRQKKLRKAHKRATKA